MRIVSILFFLIFGLTLSAQEQDRYRRVADVFMEAYNAENYDRIFGMFDSVMQQGLSLEKTYDFLGEQIRTAVG